MARIKNLIFVILLSGFCSACSLNNKLPELQQEPSSLMTGREESANFFSRMHASLRDTERATYDFMYEVRDNIDRFVYDAQKDYYENYQK